MNARQIVDRLLREEDPEKAKRDAAWTKRERRRPLNAPNVGTLKSYSDKEKYAAGRSGLKKSDSRRPLTI